MRCLAGFALAGLVLGAVPVWGQEGGGAGYRGEFWDTGPLHSIDEALAWIDGHDPTGTFVSTLIDYPNGEADDAPDATDIRSFLGVDGTSYAGTAPQDLSGSVFRISGTIRPGPGLRTYRVWSDDGFALFFDGREVSRNTYERTIGSTDVTRDAGDGTVDFVLVYFENGGVTGVEFTLNGAMIDKRIAAGPPEGADGERRVLLRRP